MCTYFLFFLLVFSLPIQSDTFLYPVAAYGNDTDLHVFIMCQHSHEKTLELLEWKPFTCEAFKIVSPWYNPAGVQLIPGNTSFSFIDNDRIRIKSFLKRSVRSLSLSEPVYDIGPVSWINENGGYFSAKEHEYFGIFHIDCTGTVTPLLAQYGFDYMYPQKIDSNLLFIERQKNEKTQSSAIKLCVYPDISSDSDNRYAFSQDKETQEHLLDTLFKQGIEQDVKKKSLCNAQIIFKSNNRALVHLRTITSEMFFVLEHPLEFDPHEQTLPFLCHIFKKEYDIWIKKVSLPFSLPKNLILASAEGSLSESLLPFIPASNQESLFFMDTTPQGRINIFRYSFFSGAVSQLTNAQHNQHFFSPLPFRDKLFYGGKVQKELSLAEVQVPVIKLEQII